MKSILIYNPKSGKGITSSHLSYIKSHLDPKFGTLDMVPTSPDKGATQIAHTECGNYDYIFVMGGDGTLSETINGIMQSPHHPIVGYIPNGTVNDVAHSIKMNRNIKKAVKQLNNGKIFNHDVMHVNNNYGMYVCAGGLFTHSSYKTPHRLKKIIGKLSYFIYGLREIHRFKPIHVTLQTPQEVINKKCILAMAINSRSVAGFALNKHANLGDNTVDVIMFEATGQRARLVDILTLSKAYVFGLKSVLKNKHVTFRQLSEFEISFNGHAVNIDGEQVNDQNLVIHVKEKLKMIVPYNFKE